MTSTDTLYRLFGVPSTCTDDELRRAYHRALLEHHPDKNRDHIASATVKTQQLTLAYAALMNRRSPQAPDRQNIDGDAGSKITVDGLEFTIEIGFSGGLDINDIAARKLTFREQWEAFRAHPSDPLAALRLVHAAFGAERQDSVKNLLHNPILIDSASLLLSIIPKDDACETLVRWAETLQESKKGKEAVQILEDAFATGKATPTVTDELRNVHYSWAQYVDPTTGSKATPRVRLDHLHRILDLGFKYDYIYKMMAEAYHDLGDDEQARSSLRQAYELNPQLSGAVHISRALGLAPPRRSLRKQESPHLYIYAKPEQIPSSSQLNDWVRTKNWDAVIRFANPQDYSPRILPKSRNILRQIASSLECWNSPRATEALIDLLSFRYYWDVSETAMTSLSKMGDERALNALEDFRASNSRERSHLQSCLSYLRERLRNRPSSVKTDSTQEQLALAEQAFAKKDYGEARVLLENVLANSAPPEAALLDARVLLARTCAEMQDAKNAIQLIGPVLSNLPRESRGDVIQDVTSWLWSDLVFQEYAPHNDDHYVMALDLHLELMSVAESPDDVLKNLRSLTRWLELLGSEDLVQWIRQLIRTEAPGTWYVDKQSRDQYVRKVDLSPHMKRYLVGLTKLVKARAATKLRQTLKSIHTFENPKSGPAL